jgi:hypothetical protein
MKSMRLLPLLVLLVLLAGCADAVASTSGVTTPAPASIASLVVTGAPSRAGAVVTLSARLTADAIGERTGAYAARIEYDPAVLTYVGQGTSTSGLVAFNDTLGVLRVAGASLDGYADGVLFNARFKVTRTAQEAEMRLVIDELRDLRASDRLPAEAATRSALLRPWK